MTLQKMPACNAQDRQISLWFQKVENGEIKLPRFQRHQAWDRHRIASLLETVIHNLPLGITLILNVDEEQFISRYIATAPETNTRVTEHLLDGQQRLTALWRTLNNNYESEKYFLYLSKYDKYDNAEAGDEYIFSKNRWTKKDGTVMPLWTDSPEKTFYRGYIPMELFRPGDISREYEKWVGDAMLQYKPQAGEVNYEDKLEAWMQKKQALLNEIRDVRETIAHYNLPYLALPTGTNRETALQVFINMNTNSKPLSQHDIIRAQVEDLKDISLDELETTLNVNHPNIKFYFDISFLVLATSALMQDKLPNQRGMWDMDKSKMIDNWSLMSKGLSKMANFMESQGIHDKKRLPTNAALSVIAALYTSISESLDHRGNAEIILKKYLWSSFFTDRYENSAATHAFADYSALKSLITGSLTKDGKVLSENEVPVFNRDKHELVTKEELLKVGWPKRENIRARGIMAVFTKLGAFDFADGSQLTRSQLLEGKRHYHHVFPDDLIKNTDSESYLALNCSLITDKTNLNISNKEPFQYLSERYDWTSEDIVNTRLKSHLIPIEELKNGGYEGLSSHEKEEKIINDYNQFVSKRADYVLKAVSYLVNGRDISANDIINEVEKENK